MATKADKPIVQQNEGRNNVEIVPVDAITPDQSKSHAEKQPTIGSLDDLKFDAQNANKGSARGKKMLKNSLRKYGAGRSILIDADNTVIAGNKTLEAARAQGYKKVQIVEAHGEALIAVRRTDLKLQRDTKQRELAIHANRT